jgi:DNA-binding MarR family transcriptional regulator
MTFERQRRVAGLWAWLPTFRMAAEYESVQRAALVMHVSPSAVSRTIKQLEKALGFVVFERSTAGVKLTARGARLLEATRSGMRVVDDALEAAVERVRVAASAPFLPALVARAMTQVDRLSLITVRSAEAAEAVLHRGEVDLAFVHQPTGDPTLEARLLCQLEQVITRGGTKGEARFVSSSGDGEFLADDLHAMFELAASQRVGVLVPGVLAPAGVPCTPVAAPLAVYAVRRRSAGEAPTREHQVLAALERALRALRPPGDDD